MNVTSSNLSHPPASVDEKVVRRALGHYVIGLASRRCTSNLAAGATSQAGSTRNYIFADRWTCTICQRDMNVRNKEAHLSGKPHKLAAHSLQASKSIEESESRVSYIAPIASQSSMISPTRSPSGSPSTWKCKTCDRSIQVKNKKTHLNGKVHRANLAANGIHPTSKWKCTICQKEMLATQKGAHLAGKVHQEAVSGPIAGSSAARNKGVKSKARKPNRRHSKQSDDGDDSNSTLSTESGLGLLHDIDTAFGLLPGGGAYKESNFYYGPGIHDYY